MSEPILLHADCLDILRTLDTASVDACVTDPPYELGFMGKKWDGSGIAYSVELWREALRVLKPGGHLVAFGGTRTYHRMACAIEDAGFEIRDSLTWLYGSGFPKSLDVGKAIDKAAGAQREVVGTKAGRGATPRNDMRGGQYGSAPVDLIDTSAITAPATDAARQWQGWGTALKPAVEPIVLARKPLSGTVAANVIAHGTGALNIDGTRVAHSSPADLATSQSKNPGRLDVVTSEVYGAGRPQQSVNDAGRWPANVLLTHGESCADVCTPGCPVAELDAQSGTLKTGGGRRNSPKEAGTYGAFAGDEAPREFEANEGGATRFFPVFRYQAKAPAKERPKVAVPPKLRLRSDLTDEQRARVLAELTHAMRDLSAAEVPAHLRAYFEEVMPSGGEKTFVSHPT